MEDKIEVIGSIENYKLSMNVTYICYFQLPFHMDNWKENGKRKKKIVINEKQEKRELKDRSYTTMWLLQTLSAGCPGFEADSTDCVSWGGNSFSLQIKKCMLDY